MLIQRRLRIAIWSGVIAFVAVIAGVSATLVSNGRRDALNESDGRIVRFANGAEASLNRTLIAADLMLADMRDVLDATISPDGTLDRAGANRRLQGIVRRNLLFRNIAVLDERGRVLATARDETERLGVPLPEPFVRETLAQPTPVLAISAPVLNFASAERALYFARPMQLAPGRRALVVAETPLSQIAAFRSLSTSPRPESNSRSTMSKPPAWANRGSASNSGSPTGCAFSARPMRVSHCFCFAVQSRPAMIRCTPFSTRVS